MLIFQVREGGGRGCIPNTACPAVPGERGQKFQIVQNAIDGSNSTANRKQTTQKAKKRKQSRKWAINKSMRQSEEQSRRADIKNIRISSRVLSEYKPGPSDSRAVKCAFGS